MLQQKQNVCGFTMEVLACAQTWSKAHWGSILVLLVTDTENEKEGGKKKRRSQINQPASIHQGKKFIQVLLNKQ